MQEHLNNIKSLIDISVQKGVFQDANSVLVISNSFNEIAKLIEKLNNERNNTTN
jgi:hypothetical protein